MTLDMPAMAVVSNVYRAAGAIRNHFEHTVLAPYNLTWTGWVVLWVVWIWQEIETRHVAAEAGISVPLIQRFAGEIPILGVCLGHQSIGQAFGGTIVRARRVMHGKISPVTHDGRGVFADVPVPFAVTRYHSLAIERESVPEVLEVTATSDDGEIMGVRHRQYAVEGVQFHPEAILTEHGKRLLANFLEGKS